MYKTGTYILGIILLSLFPLLSISDMSKEEISADNLNLKSLEIKEEISINKEIQVDSLKNKVRQEIILLNKELNIK